MCCGERFWSFDLTVMRQSGTADTIEVNCPQLVLETVGLGNKLCLEGQVRSYAKTIDGKSRLSVALFALKTQEHKADCNEVELEGYLCEKPEFRTTPRGRDICYAMLAVNRERGKSDYIPQVFWDGLQSASARCRSERRYLLAAGFRAEPTPRKTPPEPS
jgi:hypothetical protein